MKYNKLSEVYPHLAEYSHALQLEQVFPSDNFNGTNLTFDLIGPLEKLSITHYRDSEMKEQVHLINYLSNGKELHTLYYSGETQYYKNTFDIKPKNPRASNLSRLLRQTLPYRISENKNIIFSLTSAKEHWVGLPEYLLEILENWNHLIKTKK